MIARLRGTLALKRPEGVVVDVGGVGYGLTCPLSTFYDLPDEGGPADLHVHTHVREDALELFGFGTVEELAVFKLLITVGGIGPRLACNILSGIGPVDLAEAVGRGDLARLTAVPGVGKKTAERMVVELKDKLGRVEWAVAASEGPRPAAPEFDDALSALTNLGYSPAAAKKGLDQVIREQGDGLALAELLRLALKVLAK